jgi:hypothetical protein
MHFIIRRAMERALLAVFFVFSATTFAGQYEPVKPIPVFSGTSLPGTRADVPALGAKQTVAIMIAPLRSGKDTDSRLRFDFLGRSVIVERQRLELGSGNGVVWHGRPIDEPGTVILSTAGKVVFGRIELGTKVYKIEPIGSGDVHIIYEIDPSKEQPLGNDALVPPGKPDSKIDQSAATTKVTSRGADDGSLVDLLVLYTDGFALKYPGDQLDAQINFIVGVANTSYTNSQIGLRARVVRREQVSYTDGGDLGTPLSALTNGTDVFTSVSTWRNASGADMVSLLRVFQGPGTASPNGACGVAWLMTSLSPSFASNAFSVVQVGTSNGYYCTDQTFVHELGHNMGSHHNWENNDTGLYSYSRGTEFPISPATPLYHTVMSYNLTGTPRVSYFSNPSVLYNGYSTGVSNVADNARSIGNSKQTVTQWRATVPLFADVPTSHFAWEWIEGLSRAGITSGCGSGIYCPNDSVTRAQMAVFLERGIHGTSYVPPPATGTLFGDVGAGDFAAAWIEQLAADSITSGCGGGNYCPNDSVTRAQMAVFLLRAKHGSSYTPPVSTCSTFADVPPGSFACEWIEQLYSEAITSGCGGGNYCPNDSVTRGQMAVFLIKTFGLPY